MPLPLHTSLCIPADAPRREFARRAAAERPNSKVPGHSEARGCRSLTLAGGLSMARKMAAATETPIWLTDLSADKHASSLLCCCCCAEITWRTHIIYTGAELHPLPPLCGGEPAYTWEGKICNVTGEQKGWHFFIISHNLLVPQHPPTRFLGWFWHVQEVFLRSQLLYVSSQKMNF